jgi:hypothetical protein
LEDVIVQSGEFFPEVVTEEEHNSQGLGCRKTGEITSSRNSKSGEYCGPRRIWVPSRPIEVDAAFAFAAAAFVVAFFFGGGAAVFFFGGGAAAFVFGGGGGAFLFGSRGAAAAFVGGGATTAFVVGDGVGAAAIGGVVSGGVDSAVGAS